MRVERMTIQQIADALQIPCVGTGSDEITGLCTDSREVAPGMLFVALKGERTDGHCYIKSALENGAAYALADHMGDYPPDRTLIVPNTLRAIMQIAEYYRRKFDVKVVAITGSVGKTTTKDMVTAVVESAFRTIHTEGNQNNEIGGPKTILRIAPETEAAVIEMGMSAFGEIRDLSWAAKPQIGVITNVGVSHIENLGSRENILKAKLELADALPDGATLFLCGDNDLLSQVHIPRLNVVFYGLENCENRISGQIIRAMPEKTDFIISCDGKEWPAAVPGMGKHLVLNALAAFGVGLALGIEPEQIINSLKNYLPSGMRQKVVNYKGMTVVEDCYNASPDSMQAAISALKDYPVTGRKILVLSDMLELGKIAVESHFRIGELSAGAADILLSWGNLAQEYVKGAQAAGMQQAWFFSDKQKMMQKIASLAQPGDVLWFKASRGMKLEECIKFLYECC